MSRTLNRRAGGPAAIASNRVLHECIMQAVRETGGRRVLLTYLFDSRDKDVVFDRVSQREYYTNVPLLLQHHADGGIDWGCSCPEALDLALNILNWWIPPAIDERIPVFLDSGVASRTAWELHRDFMIEFLIRIPYEGGCLPVKRAHHWIVDKMR